MDIDIKEAVIDGGEDSKESAVFIDENKENATKAETNDLEGQASKEPIEILSVELVKTSEEVPQTNVEKHVDEACPNEMVAESNLSESNNTDNTAKLDTLEKAFTNVDNSEKLSNPEEGNKKSTNTHTSANTGESQESYKDAAYNTEEGTNISLNEEIPTNSENVDIYLNKDLTISEHKKTATSIDENPSENIENNSNTVANTNISEDANNTIIQNETMEVDTTTTSTTGLSLLAQYGSDNEANDSDNDSVIEVPLSVPRDYRSNIVEIDSDSDSDSSSSDSDVEYLKVLRKTIEKRIEVDDDEDDDEADNNSQAGVRKKPTPKVKAKGELQLEDLPPIHDLQITVPEDECIELGKIHSIVDQLVLVSALPNSVLLDLETVLFLDRGQRVLGVVFDVLGQVADPLYCVRFNSNEQINDKNIQVNDTVYLAPKTQYTQYIILSSLMKVKGSDASWENDLEPPPRFLDYSDDEQEQMARRQLRNKDRPVDHEDAQKRVRTDAEEPQVSSHGRPQSTQPRQRYPSSTRGFGGPPNRGSYSRPPRQPYNVNPQYGNPQTAPNHHPSSWHSNYYPQPFTAMPPPNVAYGGGYPPMPVQGYSQVPVYPMAIPYPPPQQHGRPNNHPPERNQYAPNAFNMRPPTMPGGHFDPSQPPPGSQ